MVILLSHGVRISSAFPPFDPSVTSLSRTEPAPLLFFSPSNTNRSYRVRGQVLRPCIACPFLSFLVILRYQSSAGFRISLAVPNPFPEAVHRSFYVSSLFRLQRMPH